ATLNGWIVSDARPLNFDSQPAPENEVYSSGTHTTRLTAAVNETVAFQLALRREGQAPDGPYDVVVSDLAGPNGILPARPADLFRIHPVRVTNFRSWYPEPTGRSATPIEVPDVLVVPTAKIRHADGVNAKEVGLLGRQNSVRAGEVGH